MTAFQQRRSERRRRVAALHASGMSMGQIASKLGCAKGTVHGDIQALGLQQRPVEVTPVTAGETIPALEVLKDEGIQLLRLQAQRSSTAAQKLVKVAEDGLEAERLRRCQFHVTEDEQRERLDRHYQIWLKHLKGPFMRRLALELSVDIAYVSRLIEDVIEDVIREVNAYEQRMDELEAIPA